MTSGRRAWIIDVGHGNSTVVETADHVSIIDGGKKDSLVRFLNDRGIDKVDTIIVSHADEDHFGGISLLLANRNFQVGKVFVNPDPRDTKVWRDFISVMLEAKERGVKFGLELTTVNPGEITFGNTRLEIVAPSQELAYTTATGHAPDGRRLNPNSMSAVVRVWDEELPRLLIAGDIDQIGFDNIDSADDVLKADVLLFPHHGGLPGDYDAETFAGSLARAVGAKLVVFSIGRGRYGTPRPEVVNGVLRNSSDVHIACTQLSEHCATEMPTDDSTAPKGAFAEGRAKNACCAGTMCISLEDTATYSPARQLHQQFVNAHAPTALCQRPGASAAFTDVTSRS